MPRFYLHIQGSGRVEDVEGGYYPDVDAARRDAVVCVREIIAERVRFEGVLPRLEIEICDEAGQPVGIVRSDDVFRLA